MKKPVREIGGFVSEADAQEWIQAYQNKNPDATKAHLFGRDLIDEMLADPKCEGIWIFNAWDEKVQDKWGKAKLVLYKADSEGKIINEAEDAARGGGGGPTPGDLAEHCPPVCP
ncbi:MAG: hypothetical protein KI790_06505 [Cyclobacteriaceae bacterium]|nr:hypothetical protein [Cyclobacteriaceae bacterium HetDA_MAG_MS6]